MVTITCVARASCPLSRERLAPASARAGCPRPSGRDARATKTIGHYILQSSVRWLEYNLRLRRAVQARHHAIPPQHQHDFKQARRHGLTR